MNPREPMAEDPPYSRLFVLYNRKDPMTDVELQNDFSAYGNVQDIFMVKDKATGEQKGMAYVKFSKMSEAALAIEHLNNKPIKNHNGIYKVFIAKNRNEGKGSDNDDPDRYTRLFVMVPKEASENDVKKYFSQFGDIQSVKLLRYKETNESRGIGYVTFCRIYEAAKAVEASDKRSDFKAVIARPKEKNPSQETNVQTSAPPPKTDIGSSEDAFNATVSAKLSKDQIFRLFDIAPGLRNIQVLSQNSYRSQIEATYNSTLAAEYALNKLHGIEYPLGEFISVESKSINKSNVLPSNVISAKRDYRGEQIDYRADSPSSRSNDDMNERLTVLSKALDLLKSAGLTAESGNVGTSMYCDFPLPAPQTILPKSAFSEETGMRLFFVGHPSAPSVEALCDVYCRFGNFAGATVLQKKNYGYLYFASPESAKKAIEATDDKIISGMSMKVLKADPKGEPSSKRVCRFLESIE